MFHKRNTVIWVFLVAVSSALPSLTSRGVSHSSTPLPPSQDPFHTAQAGFESALPGTILRLRPAPGNLTAVIGNCSSAYNILYRTTNSLYKPTWAVTTLYVPSIPSSQQPVLAVLSSRTKSPTTLSALIPAPATPFTAPPSSKLASL